MSRLFSFSLYYTSFAPLWVSILFIDIRNCLSNNENLWTEKISIGCIFLCCLMSIVVLIPLLSAVEKGGVSSFILQSAQEEKTITAEYLLSYILPLFAFDFTKWNEVLLFLIFFLTLAFLCIRHNYFSVNIILEIAGFRFFNCKLKNEDGVVIEKKIVSRRRLNGCIGEELYLKALNNEYELDVQNISSGQEDCI